MTTCLYPCSLNSYFDRAFRHPDRRPARSCQNSAMATNGKTTAPKSVPAAPASQIEGERYTAQAREAYLAMESIWTEKWTLAQAAQELGKSKDELAIQFAIFGVQAMEALRTKGVVSFP